MTKLQFALGVALLLIVPPAVLAQSAPVVYVCTPDGQVLEVGTVGPRVIATDSGGAFDDCVFGLDGWLYIS